MSRTLAEEWFTEIVSDGVDASLPGLYEWWVDGLCIYVGQYTHASRPRREYSRNLRRLFAGLPYRKSKPDAFRHVHHSLAEAIRKRHKIDLRLVESQPDKTTRNRRERELYAERIGLRGATFEMSRKRLSGR